MPTQAQQLMIADGFPEAGLVPQDERRAMWKGRKLTKPKDLNTPTKSEDPATKALRKELAEVDAKKRAERFARLKALRTDKQYARDMLRAVSAGQQAHNPEGETTMKSATESKTGKADQVKALREKRANTKGAAKKGKSKKAATAKARTPAAAGDRSRYDWKGAEEKALAGTIPPKPDFSAPTHARFLPIMEEIAKACSAKDLKALKAIQISPISSTPKAMDRYRGLCVKALTNAK